MTSLTKLGVAVLRLEYRLEYLETSEGCEIGKVPSVSCTCTTERAAYYFIPHIILSVYNSTYSSLTFDPIFNFLPPHMAGIIRKQSMDDFGPQG